MKYRTTHIKILSLLLTIVMALSTAMVFAEVEGTAPDADGSETVEIITDETTDPAQLLQGSNENVEVVEKNEVPALNAKGADDGEQPDEPVTPSVVLDPTTASIKIGGTVKLTATTVPDGCAVTWNSDNTAVAEVSEDGTVTGISAGTANVTASIEVEGTTYTSDPCVVEVVDDSFTAVAPVATWTKKYDKNDYEGSKDNGYTMSWTHSDKTGVDAYQILRDSTVIATVGKDKSSYELMALYGDHEYSVRAVQYGADGKTVAKSIPSNKKKYNITGVITATHAYTWWCKSKRKAVIYKSSTGGAKLTTVAKGTKMTAVGRYPSVIKKFKNPVRVQVQLSNGKKGWIKYKDLSGGVKSNAKVSLDYSRSLKEYMINSTSFTEALKGKKITSGTNYVIWACLYTQRAYTFQKKNGKWELIHTDRITTGKFSHPTRSSETSGEYTVKKKVQGKVWMVQENGKRYYFTHASYITNGISFHTGTWWASGKTRGTIKANGQPGTYGCIRMKTEGAKYIFGKTTVGKTGVIVTRFH